MATGINEGYESMHDDEVANAHLSSRIPDYDEDLDEAFVGQTRHGSSPLCKEFTDVQREGSIRFQIALREILRPNFSPAAFAILSKGAAKRSVQSFLR